MHFEELYQDIILDHSRRPRNYGELPDADATVNGNNPMCGDDVTLQVKFDAADREKIAKAAFTGNGCSICMASASLLTLKVKNRTRAEAGALAEKFQNLVTGVAELAPEDESLGDLQVLIGVRKFPQRVKCATLAWHALEEALEH
ncbi:MAG TPA: SUF system NifU family Fe-S cluster assembly protein [Chthoniobacterales bacterium]